MFVRFAGLLLVFQHGLAARCLEGRFTDGATGLPVAGVDVRLAEQPRSAVSDGEGRWAFDDLAPGCWHLSATHVSYHTLEREVCLDGAGVPFVGQVLHMRVLELPEARVLGARPAGVVEHTGPGTCRLALDDNTGSDLAALAARLPGVQVQHEGGAGAVATVSVDGCPPREVLVCLDGVPLNEGGNRAVDLNRIDTGPLAAMELRRGADPTRGALGGVLNLVTRQGSRPRQRLDAEAAHPDARSLSLGVQSRAGQGLLEAGGRLQRGHGRYPYTDPQTGLEAIRRNTDARRDALSIGWNSAEAALQRLTMTWHEREAGIGDRIDLSDEWMFREREQNVAVQAVLRTRRFKHARLWWQQDSRVTRGSPSGERSERERSGGLELEAAIGSGRPVFHYRVTERFLDYRAVGPGSEEFTGRLELRNVIAAAWHRGRLEGGVQLWNEDLRFRSAWVVLAEVQPLSLGRNTDRGVTLDLTAGSGVRLPSFLERFPVGGAQVLGNPELAPEQHHEARMVLAAWVGGPERRLRVETGLLQRQSRELIVWRQTNAAAWKPFNLGEARLRQWHGGLSARFGSHWAVSGELRLRDPRNLAAGINHGRYLTHQPLHAWQARLDWNRQPEPRGLRVSLDAESAGRSYSGESNLEGLDGASLDPWWVLGAELATRGGQSSLDWGWSVSVDNLLDRDVRQVPKVPLPGRAFRVSLWFGHSGEL